MAEFAVGDEARQAAERDERRLSEIRRENERLRSRTKQLETERDDLAKLVQLLQLMEEADPEPPGWLSPARPKANHATAVVQLSDMHFDEVVNPSEMDGLNAYNREIATLRLERWAQNVIKLTRDYLAGVTFDGLVVILGGDGVSGTIHDELRRTNAAEMFDTQLYWLEQMAAALGLLADQELFPKLHVVEVPGNHPRNTPKRRYKGRAKDNMDWALAKLLEREFRRDTRFTFQIPDSFQAHFDIYGRGQLVVHGDDVGGGGGIGGIWPPLMRMRARLQAVHMTIGRPFDTLWVHHFHQYISGPGLVVNGSLKGYDEFARGNAFTPELAQQSLTVVTPEHGISWQAPVVCTNRKREGW